MKQDDIEKLSHDQIHEILKYHFPIHVLVTSHIDVDGRGDLGSFSFKSTSGGHGCLYGLLYCEAEVQKIKYLAMWGDD